MNFIKKNIQLLSTNSHWCCWRQFQNYKQQQNTEANNISLPGYTDIHIETLLEHFCQIKIVINACER